MRRARHEAPVGNRTVSIMTRMIPRNESDCMTRSVQSDSEPTPRISKQTEQQEVQNPPRISQTVPHYPQKQMACPSIPPPTPLLMQPSMQSSMQSSMQASMQSSIPISLPSQYAKPAMPRSTCPGLAQFESLSYGVPQPKPPPVQHFPLVHQAFTASCGICGRFHRHNADILPCSRCQQYPQQGGDLRKETSLKKITPQVCFQSRGAGPSETDVAVKDMYQDNIREQPTRECCCGTGAKCMCASSQSAQNIATSVPKKDTCVSFKINADEARKSVLKTMKADSHGSLHDATCSCNCIKAKCSLEPESICKPCEEYYSREAIEDTVWTVKIMKDVGIMSEPDGHNVVDTQTSETRIITADDLECLLPPETRYIPEEDYAEGDGPVVVCPEGDNSEPVKRHSQVTSTTNFPAKKNRFLQTKQTKGKKKKICVIM